MLDLAALFSHPVQYFSPLFRELDRRSDVRLTVYYCSDDGAEPTVDPGFGMEISWDVPLLEGYEYDVLRDYSPDSCDCFPDRVNPGIATKLKRADHDALLVNGYTTPTNWIAFASAQATDTPIVFRGASTLQNPPEFPVSAIKRVVLRNLFSTIDAFAAVGQRNGAFFREYGVPDKDIFFAPNTVDNQFFQSRRRELPDRDTLREELSLPADEPVILYVGKLIPIKCVDILLKAFERTLEHGDATLLIVGDGPQRTELERDVTRLGLDESVVFTGFKNQTELPKYYEMSDIFAFPSARETWGLVINEAMNFGLPIVTTDGVSAAPDLVNEQNGIVVPKRNPSALASALRALVTDATLRAELGAVSRERIDEWSVADTADGILEAAYHVRTSMD